VKPTHEELANILGVVYTAIQFPGCPCVVDSDLNGCGVRQRQVWRKGGSENPRRDVHILPSSFPYISSSGISADHCERGSALEQGVVRGLERGSWEIRYTVVAPGNVGEVPARMARG